MTISPFNWIRDALGIHKDQVELQKARLEIKKLELEIERLQSAQSIILKATQADIEKYGRKVSDIDNQWISYLNVANCSTRITLIIAAERTSSKLSTAKLLRQIEKHSDECAFSLIYPAYHKPQPGPLERFIKGRIPNNEFLLIRSLARGASTRHSLHLDLPSRNVFASKNRVKNSYWADARSRQPRRKDSRRRFSSH